MDSIEAIRHSYIEPQAFDEELDRWEDLWDFDASLYENYKSIIQRFVILPWEDDLLPMIAGYLCMSAKWSQISPIMFCWGLQGSGKSTLANLAVALRGVGCAFSPNDTFASIRNEINRLKYFDPDECTLKRDNTLMAWDNIYSSSFDVDPKLYRLLLVGYDQRQSIMRFAGKNGVNYEFDVFCPKIISSVEAIHCASALGELQRRLLIIPHKQIDAIKDSGSQDKLDNLLQLTQIDWRGIELEFQKHWLEKDTCHNFVSWRNLLQKVVKRKSSKIALAESVSHARWTISLDIAASILACSACDDPQAVLNIVGSYWSRIDQVCGVTSPLKEHLETFIENAAGDQIRINAAAAAKGMPPMCTVTLNAADLKGYMELCFSEGKIEEFPSVKKLSPVMAELGWKLSKKGWIQSF